MSAFYYSNIKCLFEEIFFSNDYIFETKKENPIILDCGANIGFATLFFKWLYPKSIIYSFEPGKEAFKMLEKNIKNNDLKNVYLYNTALSDKDGEIDFFINENNPGSLVMNTKHGTKSEKIECKSLCSIIKDKEVDFAKIDIEGSEKEVIEDLFEKNKLKNIKELVIEYHHIDNKEKLNLSSFLKKFEDNNFRYQIYSQTSLVNTKNKFQTLLLYLYQ